MTAADVCMDCTRNCGALCALTAAEFPVRDRETIAATEARGQAWAGQISRVGGRCENSHPTLEIEVGGPASPGLGTPEEAA